MKRFTGLPCPSCGSTRSVLSLVDGNLSAAVLGNPLGLILFMIMMILPAWLLYDFIRRKNSLLKSYGKTEVWIRKSWIAIPSVILILGNWIWNIQKGL